MQSIMLFLLFNLWFISMQSKPIFVEIRPGGEECYYEKYAKDEIIDFLYVVKRGGDHDIELKIYSPFNTLVTQKIGQNYERFKEQIGIEGEYKICINNDMSRFTSKVVGIDLLGSHRSQEMHYNQLTKARHLNVMERSVLNIGRKLDAIERLQSLAVGMEETYEDTVLRSSSMSAYMTAIELYLVLVVYLYQIKTIRSWFKSIGHGHFRQFHV